MDIVTREQWGARPPKRIHFIDTPTPELWLHHTGGHEVGTVGMRQIQAFHMAPKPKGRGWSDIAYSFVVDEDLTVYEARGAGVAGGHTADHNTISHAICVMGNYETRKPTIRLIDRIAELVAHGHAAGWWPARITGGHRDASGASTACPGRWLQAAITTINTQAQLPATEETDMPPPITYQQAMSDLDELWLAYRREMPPDPDRRAWARDMAEKCFNRGDDLRPTLAYIEWVLREQFLKAGGK